jgi:predicted naringenin-chalcone synthase
MDADACILLCCVELCSLHYQYTSDADRIVANSLFSDGAAALVCSKTSARSGAWSVLDQRSTVLPDTQELMSWRIDDHGFVMNLSPRVPDVVCKTLRPWASDWLAQHSLAIEDIGCWAIHPGGPRILVACATGLRLDQAILAPSQKVLSDFGNMSSPTILFILAHLRQLNASPPCVALAFGPGLTIEGALLGYAM